MTDSFSAARGLTLPRRVEGDIVLLANVFLECALCPFLRVVPSDAANQPLPMMLCVLFTLAVGYRIAFDAPARFCLAVLSCAAVNVWVTSLNHPAFMTDIFFELIGYVSVLMAFAFAVNFQQHFSVRLIRFNIVFLAALGLLQSGFLSAGVANATYGLMRPFITRPPELIGSRGAALWTSEPSFAAQIICLLFYLWYLLDGRTAPPRRRYFYLTCFGVLFVTCGSGTLVAYLAIGAACYVLSSRRNMIFTLLATATAGVAFYLGAVMTGLMPARIKRLFDLLYLPFSSGAVSVDPVWLLAATTGNRGPLALVAYGTPYFEPFGNGLAHWRWGVVEASRRAGVYFDRLPLRTDELYRANKPNGFAATSVYEMGWLGYALIGYLLFITVKAVRRHRQAAHYWIIVAAVISGLTQIILSGLTFLGCPWLLVALAFRKPNEI